MPNTPSDLSVEADHKQLVLKWTAAPTATGYDVQYTSATPSAVNDSTEASGSTDPSMAWVAVSRTGPTPSQTISSLDNGTPYRVRVRSKNSNGASFWVFGAGTPAASNDAGLKAGAIAEALSVTSSTSATGTFTSVALEITGSTGLGGTVPNSHTHAKITATVNHPGATVKVGKQGTTLATVASGSASGAIALAVGANVIEVVVTAEDGTTMQTRTVTITRQAAQPTDATLYRLTATSSTSAAGTFTALNIGTFAASTTSYTATVPSSHTHAKITPSVSNPNATVKVGKGASLTTVASGSASPAIPLVLGANAINVEVTAADGTTKRTYTVTITRPSANADLSGLTATTSTTASGPFAALNIGMFASGTTAYTATVAHSVTHVKLTPTVTHSSARVRVGKGTSLTAVTSGSASPAIALVVGANAVKAEVTAEDGTTKKTYTVTVTRQQESTATPAAPTELVVAAGHAQLALSWTAPSGTLTGYDVHYTSAAAGTVSNTAAASGSDASAAWVAVMRTGTTASQTISSLTNGTDYRVRLRARNSNGNSDWAFGAGTPAAPTAGVPAAPTGLTVSPGDRQLALSWTAPSGTLTGYDLDYTTSTTVSSTAAASGSNPFVAWVAHLGTAATTTTETLFGLTNGTRYRVRLRARNTAGAGAWAFGAGTPNLFARWTSATFSLRENDRSAHQFTLTEDAVSRSISGTVTYAVGATNGASLSDDLTAGYATTFSAQANGFPTLRLATPVNDDVNEEHETFTVTIDSGTGYTVGTPATLTVTITDDDPPAAPKLSLTAGVGAGKLAASWTKPAGPVTGYQLRYKEASAASQTATTTGDPSTGWVTSAQSTTTAEITGLTTGTAYEVQVRANDGQTQSGNGWSLWSNSQSGTGPSNDASLNTGILTSATSSTSATGTFTPVALEITSATNLSGTVPNSHTHAKVTATVHHPGATLKVGKQGTTLAAAASGSPSGAIALAVGANVIEVVVTSEDGTATNTRTVTITREAAPTSTDDATLSGLTATSSTSASGPFTALTLTPSTFSATTTSYTATVANSVTHAKLTPTVNNSSATVTVAGTTVSSGSASGAIALSVGSNAISVVVTAADGTTTQTYTVTITRQSSNANLSGLTATTSTSSTGTFSALNIGTFAASTTSYTATVAFARTHAKLTPTVAHSAATVTVAGTTVSSGSASGAIALSVGSNAISVVVTAEDGTTTQTYTVTITRQSANANLSGLTATTSESSTGTFTALNIGTFAAATTSYTATVAFARTHAKLTPTVAHSAATVTVQGTTVSSGSASGAIALSVGSNALTVRVTAQDGTTKDYTVTIERQAEAAPPAVSLSASPTSVTEGSSVTVTATLSKSHSSALTIPLTITDNTAESGDHGSLASITIASGATSGTGTITTNQDADTNDETFTVSLGTLPSAVTEGTPSSVQITIDDDDNTTSPVSLSAAPNPVNEGLSVTVTATLSSALSGAVTIPLTITDNTAESGDHGSLASITIASGATSGTGTITTNQDADTDDETFTVALNTASLPSLVTAGTPSSVQITINDDDDPTVDTQSDGGPAGVAQVELEPEPLQLALWTDRPGYRAGETVRLYHTLQPHDDEGSYRTFLYLEQAGGERRYLSPLQGGGQLHADAVDRYGLRADTAVAQILAAADRVLTWEGEAPAPGLWQFVLELRPGEPSQPDAQPDSPSATTRRAWAKFTVAERSSVLNRRGFDREIRSDATLRSDTLYYLGHQLFVHDGATLTLQPGTVLLAFGRHAAIIVEPGGRIVADGTREAPVVLTCSSPMSQREPGCWGGLRILGKAPVTRLEGVAPGVLPAQRAAYGGSDADGFSGLLRYVRVEFAGAAGDEPDAAGPAIGLYGAGSATLLDHVQARHSLGSGFAFSGGSARCDHCVASSSGAAGLAWDRGWRGSAAHLYVQHGPQGLHGLDGGNDEQGHDREPRSLPTLSNVTLLHSQPYGRRARRGAGVHLRTGSGLRARDLLASHFGGGGVLAGPRASMLFTDGESSLAGALLYVNGNGRGQLRGLGLRDALEYIERKPDLRDVRYFANPDPRPKPDSPALAHEGEGYIGAFGPKDNWLEQWTVFGPESVYDLQERGDDGF